MFEILYVLTNQRNIVLDCVWLLDTGRMSNYIKILRYFDRSNYAIGYCSNDYIHFVYDWKHVVMYKLAKYDLIETLFLDIEYSYPFFL